MNKSRKKRILLSIDWFAPGYKAGGPIRSCVNFAYAMRDKYEIYVITGNKDFGDTTPYPGIEPGTWMAFDKDINIKYCEPNSVNWASWKKELSTIDPDFVYINNLFSKKFGLQLYLAKSASSKKSKWILSPRGIFRESAIKYKAFKKKLYIGFLRALGLHNKVHFLATDKQESIDIKKYFNKDSSVKIIGNFPFANQKAWNRRNKNRGQLKIIFFSRIGPIKNLDFILQLLKNAMYDISMDIIGPIEDANYWAVCQKTISTMPKSVQVKYLGELPHDKIMNKLEDYHLFALASHGENFGHAIFESFLAGCPVLISDQTPWKNLEKEKIGWALPLTQTEKFIAAINKMANMDEDTWNSWSYASWIFGNNYLQNSLRKQEYENLFS